MLDVPGGQLFYEVSGQGAPLVFLHAAIADRRMWNREFLANSGGHTVVRYDTRGLGRSPPASAAYSDVEDVRALLDHLRIGPATLVGCSNGGKIAIDLALERPSEVKALLLLAPGISGFDGSTDPEGQADYAADGVRSKEIFGAWAAGRKGEALERLREYWCSRQTGQNLELVRQMMKDNAVEIFTEASASHGRALDPPAIQRLKTIRVPTTILLGDHDEPTMGYIVRRLAKEVPAARLVDVPGADHLINLSQPDAFDTALRSVVT